MNGCHDFHDYGSKLECNRIHFFSWRILLKQITALPVGSSHDLLAVARLFYSLSSLGKPDNLKVTVKLLQMLEMYNWTMIMFHTPLDQAPCVLQQIINAFSPQNSPLSLHCSVCNYYMTKGKTATVERYCTNLSYPFPANFSGFLSNISTFYGHNYETPSFCVCVCARFTEMKICFFCLRQEYFYFILDITNVILN